ncbi:hypothetical protein U8335_04335 [Roseiconus lacunae]|uniref:hypothetical protein n=1 Tax=Roseiconus lacunae TaxID=2605694 RepID=UPI0030937009|nr:hypothetical protein U8335_04335 [Stieleria sp. HD01]
MKLPLASLVTDQAGTQDQPSQSLAGMATIAKTYAEIAARFGVSTRTVGEWKSKGCPGFGSAGEYDLEAIESWRALQLDRVERSLSACELQEELLRQDVRKRTAEADIKSFERDRRISNLISEQDVNLFASLWFREAARTLRAIPKQLAAGFAPSEQLEAFSRELEVKLETAIKSIKTKAKVLSGQAIDAKEAEQLFDIEIDEDSGYELELRLSNREAGNDRMHDTADFVALSGSCRSI